MSWTIAITPTAMAAGDMEAIDKFIKQKHPRR